MDMNVGEEEETQTFFNLQNNTIQTNTEWKENITILIIRDAYRAWRKLPRAVGDEEWVNIGSMGGIKVIREENQDTRLAIKWCLEIGKEKNPLQS
mgnify:CR=1 FL=1